MRLPKLTGRTASGTTTTAEAPVADTAETADKPQGEQPEPKQETSKQETSKQEKPTKKRISGRDAGKAVAAGTNAIRSRIASLVWLVAVVCALFLAVGALLVALDMNRQNDIVHFILSVAHKLDFGTFKNFTGKGAATKSALTNWGIAAVIYLVVGKILDKIIRP